MGWVCGPAEVGCWRRMMAAWSWGEGFYIYIYFRKYYCMSRKVSTPQIYLDYFLYRSKSVNW